MKSKIISSFIGNQFHPMLAVLIVMFCIPLMIEENYINLCILFAISMFFLWKGKRIDINVKEQKLKEGWFKKWRKLSSEGYISVFPEKETQVMRSRVNEISVSMKSVYVNYFEDKVKTHLYSAKSLEEAHNIASDLHDAWQCGVYDGIEREWVHEKE